MSSVLLIEDDQSLGASLEELLKGEGFAVTWAKTLEEAKDNQEQDHKIIILDWMLPDGQGIDFLRQMRAENSSLPVIMLTARTELIDKVVGLESGANDYLTKPFEPRELVARIRVQLRTRSNNSRSEEVKEMITIGDLAINTTNRKVSYKGEDIEMTKMEYELLRLLAESPGRAFSREEILNKVWGYENYPSTRTVDTHVLQLRQKLDDSLFETIRGVGYRMCEI